MYECGETLCLLYLRDEIIASSRRRLFVAAIHSTAWFTNTKHDIKYEENQLPWSVERGLDYNASPRFRDTEFTADNILLIRSLDRILRHTVRVPPESSCNTRLRIYSSSVPATNVCDVNIRAIATGQLSPTRLKALHFTCSSASIIKQQLSELFWYGMKK